MYCGWEKWRHRNPVGTIQGLPEDSVGRLLKKVQTQAQEGSGPLGGPEGNKQERMEDQVRAGNWTAGVN